MWRSRIGRWSEIRRFCFRQICGNGYRRIIWCGSCSYTVEVLDTSAFDKSRRLGGAGSAGYDPRMLLALLVYAYCGGVRSSRQVERLCSTDVAFRVLCAQDVPDHCTIARFRADCQDAFCELFTQVLLIAGRAGLARFGTVAIDGTKIVANASIDANRSHEWLASQVADMVAQAGRIDAAEDATQDGDRVDRVPAPLGDRTQRAQRIRQAAVEVAAQRRQRERADQAREAAALARRRRSETGEPVVGRIPNGPHRLGEATAHLTREITVHQAKSTGTPRSSRPGRNLWVDLRYRWRPARVSAAHDELSMLRSPLNRRHPASQRRATDSRKMLRTLPIRSHG